MNEPRSGGCRSRFGPRGLVMAGFLTVLLAGALPGPARSQDGDVPWGPPAQEGAPAMQGSPGPGGPPAEAEGPPSRDMVRSLRFWRMAEDLELTEEQLPRAMSAMMAMHKAEDEFRGKRREVLEKISQLLGEKQPDASQLTQQINRLQGEEESFRKDQARRRDDLLKSFSVEQRARFLLFEDEFPRHMRSLVRQIRHGERSEAGRPADRDRGPRDRPRSP